MNSAAFKRGLHDGVPIELGYFAVSLHGMMAAAVGISAGSRRTDLTDKPYLSGQFAGSEIIFCVRFIVGDGT